MLRAGLILVTVLAACDVGEVDIGGGGGVDASMNSAKAMAFASTIKPLAETKGCFTATTCHSVQSPVLTSFGALGATYKMGPSASNILVTKDVVSGTPGTHSGIPYFTAAEKTTVSTWIDMAN